MIPSREDIIDLIPSPRGTEEWITEYQNADDIIRCVYDAVKTSEGFIKDSKKIGSWIKGPVANYVNDYAHLFLEGNTIKDGNALRIDVDGVCRDIWDFMQQEWPYDAGMAETEDRQTGRTVRYMIYDINPDTFDCKHYATFAYATLRALGIPCTLRLTSYEHIAPQPQHIYVIAGIGAWDAEKKCWEQTLIVDGTMPAYNQESKEGVTQYYTVEIKNK